MLWDDVVVVVWRTGFFAVEVRKSTWELLVAIFRSEKQIRIFVFLCFVCVSDSPFSPILLLVPCSSLEVT